MRGSSMNETAFRYPGSKDFSAPLGSASSGRLGFVRGASNVTIHADSGMEDLYRARFEGPPPDVRVNGGAVKIEYPRTGRAFDWRKRAAEVTVNGDIPWEIEVRGGLSRLDADLRGMGLDSFEVEGGASRVAVTLPRPSGTVSIRVGGGASNVTIRRPAGVAARVRVGSGASNLTLDEQHLGAVGGETRLESSDYEGASDRYDIEVLGGANNLTIATG